MLLLGVYFRTTNQVADYSTLLLNQHTLFWGKTPFWNHPPHCDYGPLQFSNLTTYSCQLGRIILLGSCSIDLATQHTHEF